MSAAVAIVPSLDPSVRLRQLGPDEYVVKQRTTRSYFRVGAIEYFLLSRLDGQRTVTEVCREFKATQGERLSEAEFAEFVEMARAQGLIEGSVAKPDSTVAGDDDDDDDMLPSRKQSWLYFRIKLFNPTSVLNWLEPRLRWVWTPACFGCSMLFFAFAAWMLWRHRADFVTSFAASWRWETMVVIWVCIITATIFHEFGHGLTCKHFGGDVEEIGLLWMFGMPCMYCDVTDAWMIPERSRRLWITLAGCYCDALVFSAAVCIWRVTVLDSVVNYVAWVLASVCGTRVFLNLNPLLRLDGYYLVSDWFCIPNLRNNGLAYWKEHLRHWLWGAPRPRKKPQGRVLLTYGATSWVMAIGVFDVLALGLVQFLHSQWGWWGVGFVSVLLLFVGRRVFKGLFTSEIGIMLKTRPERTMAWVMGIIAVVTALVAIPVEHRAAGEFEVRPGVRLEVHAAVSGFVDAIHVTDGDHVQAGQVLARLRVPDLDSLVVRKQAELRESEAQLRKLQMGPRPEERAEMQQKVLRAREWHALAVRDAQRAEQALKEDLLRLDLEIRQFQTEYDYEKVTLQNVERLYQQGAVAGEARRAEWKRYALIEAQLGQANAQKRARIAQGIQQAEAEVARREKDLADVEASLKLMQAGTRPEEIEAETAHRARLQEELAFLVDQQSKLEVIAPAAGVVVAQRLSERIGQYMEKGGLLCTVEDTTNLRVEIALKEEDVAGVQADQTIQLKARSLPFDTFPAVVKRVAPSVTDVANKPQNLVVVHCEVENTTGKLKSGMTGYARICRGQQCLAVLGLRESLKYLRTEFWW